MVVFRMDWTGRPICSANWVMCAPMSTMVLLDMIRNNHADFCNSGSSLPANATWVSSKETEDMNYSP